jgi:hypothetical protein
MLSAGGTSSGQDRQALLKGFDRLKANALQAIQQGKVSMVEAQVGTQTPTKIRLVGPSEIPPVQVIENGPPMGLAVKIYGQVLDVAGQPGAFINLTKHKWQRKERFFLWLETAVPLQLAVFQNYPQTQGLVPSRQVSPDERFPETFGTILPGQPYRFPVMLEMDDNLIDEIVSFIVVRADAAVLPINGAPVAATATASATATAIVDLHGLPPGSEVTVATQAQAGAGAAAVTPPPAVAPSVAGAGATALSGITGPGGTLKSTVVKQTRDIFKELNDQALVKPATKSRLKLNLTAPPPPQLPPTSTSYGDVEILMMGPGKVAQIELTFHKD